MKVKLSDRWKIKTYFSLVCGACRSKDATHPRNSIRVKWYGNPSFLILEESLGLGMQVLVLKIGVSKNGTTSMDPLWKISEGAVLEA